MKKFTLALVTLFSTLFVSAQPEILWQRAIGGTQTDFANSILPTSDGGFIIAGTTDSSNGDILSNQGSGDIFIVKLNHVGVIEWQKSYGGNNEDALSDVLQTIDGGYIFAGLTKSNNGDVSGNHGLRDYWIVKISNIGTIEWQKCYGGTNDDSAMSLQQYSDGNYIIAGHTESINGDVNVNHGQRDIWLVKIDTTGNILWQKSLGGTAFESAASIRHTADGGFIFIGSTSSSNGDVLNQHGSYDWWVLKLNTIGAIEWQKSLGGSNFDFGHSIIQTADNGYIAAGRTWSNNGDVSSDNAKEGWLVKLNTTGSIQWTKTFGGSGEDIFFNAIQTSDGGYLTIGQTFSNNGDISGNHGGADIWTLKVDNNGTLQWQSILGGSNNEGGGSILQNVDGSYTLTGFSASNDGDVSGNHGGASDCWVVKLGSELNTKEYLKSDYVVLYPNPVKDYINLLIDNYATQLPYRITDMFGKIVKSGVLNEKNSYIKIEDLSSGVYFMQIGNKSNSLKKIVKL